MFEFNYMETKVCKRCGKELPITEFYQVPSMKKCMDNTCKNCRRVMKGRIATPETLHCPVCNRDLPYYKFTIARKSHTGRMWCCTECWANNPGISQNNYRKQYDSTFRDLIYTQKRESRLRNFIHAMWKAAKSRAEKRGIEFNIEESDIIIPEKCPLLNVPLVFGTKENYNYSPSLDRIDNTRGYIKGNVWVISKQANTMKSSATLQELHTFCTNMLRYSPSCAEKESTEVEDKELLR